MAGRGGDVVRIRVKLSEVRVAAIRWRLLLLLLLLLLSVPKLRLVSPISLLWHASVILMLRVSSRLCDKLLAVRARRREPLRTLVTILGGLHPICWLRRTPLLRIRSLRVLVHWLYPGISYRIVGHRAGSSVTDIRPRG